jgi:N-methylhydantoinase B
MSLQSTKEPSVDAVMDSDERKRLAREWVEADTFDQVTAEVTQMRNTNITHEMGETLKQTSGSPIITEAQDFSTCILDTDGNIVATGAYLVFHWGAAKKCLEAILDEYDEEDLNPGDGIIINHTNLGMPHKQDNGIVMPVFWEGEIVNWVWSASHIADIGGVSPGSFSPQVTDTYGEGITLPPTKLVHEGEVDQELKKVIQAQSRVPVMAFNDIRCFISANNVARDRIHETLEERGLAEQKMYGEISNVLTERAMRERIEKLPDGTFTSVGWCENDGDQNKTYRIECQVIIAGNELTIDLTNSDPQAPGPINTGPGAALGCSFTPIMLQLGYDLTLNAGLTEPVNVETREGTVPHVDKHGASGFGHLDAGHELSRLVTEALSEAIQMSEHEEIHDRAQAPYADDWSCETYAGVNQYGDHFAWLDMDGGGMGNGAQTVVDGLEAGGLSTQVGNRVSDVEWKEQSYPVLHLWRRLKKNGGGPGKFRGGSGLDKAMTMWNAESDELVGAFLAARFNLPPRGYGGGVAGSATKLIDYEDTDIQERWANGELPSSSGEFTSESEHLTEAKEAPHIMTDGKVVRHVVASGGGLGDPLTREPHRVAKDVRDGLVSKKAAQNAYGVILNADGDVDRDATQEQRVKLREQRLEEAEVPHN